MKINRNMSAVMTNKQLLRTENRLQQSMARLSSGFKINSAGENPAGMAISNKMRAQIDALDQAKSNAQDAVSVVQIADGALSEVSNMLQRIRELSVQAANDTNGYEDKQAIQQEIDQLKKEVNRISTDTEYNTKTLLDGSSDSRVYADGITRVNLSDQVLPGKYNLTVDKVATQAKDTLVYPAGGFADGDSLSINGVSVKLAKGMSQNDFVNAIQDAAAEAGVTVEVGAGSVELTSNLYGTKGTVDITVSKSLESMISGDYEEKDGVLVKETSGENAVIGELTVPADDKVGFTKNATWSADGNRVTILDNNGFTMDFLIKDGTPDKDGKRDETGLQDGDSVEIEVTDIGQMTIQIGSNEFQTMDVRIPEISSESLYLDTVDVTVAGGADRAIATLDEAIAKLSSIRSRLGAFQNRLEYADSSLAATHEDMTAAYSRLLDTDMAAEMTEYAQLNILNQATVSVLSQANDMPQQILSLRS